MRVDELRVDDWRVLELEVIDPALLPDWARGRRATEVRLEWSVAPGEPDEVVLRPVGRDDRRGDRRDDGLPLLARAVNPADLAHVRAHQGSVVAWVVETHAGAREETRDRRRKGGRSSDRLVVQCDCFAPADGLGGEHGLTEIGYDDVVADQVRSSGALRAGSAHDVGRWLAEEFLLQPGRRLVYHSGPGAERSTVPTAFTIFGRTWVADIGLCDGRAVIQRMTTLDRRRERAWKRLTSTTLHFVDITRQAVLSQMLQAQLEGLAGQGRSYLQLWNDYNAIERSYLIDQARKFGYATYDACHPAGEDSWRFQVAGKPPDRAFLRNVYRDLEREVELEAAREPAGELFIGGDDHSTGQGRTWSGTVVDVDIDARTVTIRPPEWRHWDDPAPPRQGALFLALTGNRIQLQRRQKARDRIADNRAEMPGLAWLLDGVPLAPPRARHYDIGRLLTRGVLGCFGGEPTEAQKLALAWAVNTPDVIVVQGPPGTGKTRFIRALQQCLAELAGRAVTDDSRLLLTSHQHEAVDNVAGQMVTREGLPSVRVDSRGRGTREVIKTWAAEVVAGLDHELRDHRAAAEEARARRLHALAASYDDAPPTPRELVGLLDEVEELVRGQLQLDLRQRLADVRLATQAHIERARADYETNRLPLARAGRALRTTPAGFADDGPDTARQALSALTGSGLLDEEALDVLREVAATEPGTAPGPDNLACLARVRGHLLGRLSDPGITAVLPARDAEVQRLLHEIADQVGAVVDDASVTVEQVLLDYRDDLAQDLDYVRRSLPAYSRVIAATCQQVDSQEMFRTLDTLDAVFGTVIVDEAARVSPLDLMIPMACARERIVLVGDHKQLPHALDLQIEKELDAALGGPAAGDAGHVVPADVKRSLFERWYEMFEPDRSTHRTIRLDEQFRMHPTLGRFVSQAFYGSPGVIRAHRSTSALTHDLPPPYQGKVALWVDVPHGENETEIRRRHSFYRPREAAVVAAQLKQLLDLDADRQLSFGAIAFYREQRDEIWRALQDLDLATIDEWGKAKPAENRGLDMTADGRERLRVGTVDAFQGKEFDVVLLSVTRSNRPRNTARGRYGHLLSENRMCVAMSRQRRLLIAVGDQAMADRRTAPVADQATSAIGTRQTAPTRQTLVEGLVLFRELCDGSEGGVVRP